MRTMAWALGHKIWLSQKRMKSKEQGGTSVYGNGVSRIIITVTGYDLRRVPAKDFVRLPMLFLAVASTVTSHATGCALESLAGDIRITERAHFFLASDSLDVDEAGGRPLLRRRASKSAARSCLRQLQRRIMVKIAIVTVRFL